MNQKVNAAQETVSEELRLLRKIDAKVDGIEEQLKDVKRNAIVYGAASGGLAGGIVSLGIMAAKLKLGG